MTKPSISPNLIFFNGTIATQDALRSMAQAVAVGQDRIVAVGSDSTVLSLAGPDTKRINLAGRLMVPGFIDTHIHFYEWALKRKGIRLDDATSLDDLLGRVRQSASGCTAGQWIMGQGFNQTQWPAPNIPTRSHLDQVAPAHPVLLWRCDLHLAVANSMALALAGIDAATPDPPDGRIERDRSGRPNGILRELAINLVRQALAPPSADAVRKALSEATAALHQWGVTGIHDVRLMDDGDGAAALRTLQHLNQARQLQLRTWVTLPGERLDTAIDLGLCTGHGDERLRIGHVKFFSDGGMGARTAWMIDPYLDADRGMPLMDMDTLAHAVRRADSAGLSVMVHAVGDRANHEVIGIFEALQAHRAHAGGPPPMIPHRIEHVQMIRPADVVRLKGLNLALNVTPANMLLDIDLIDAAVGETGKYTYAFRRLLDTGIPVMFSSDCPVCSPDPLLGIRAAVTRKRDDGTPPDGWYPQNRVTVNEAIRAYTATPAAVHHAWDMGVIGPGNKADLVILNDDVLRLPVDRLSATRVDMTVFDGEIVYRQF